MKRKRLRAVSLRLLSIMVLIDWCGKNIRRKKGMHPAIRKLQIQHRESAYQFLREKAITPSIRHIIKRDSLSSNDLPNFTDDIPDYIKA